MKSKIILLLLAAFLSANSANAQFFWKKKKVEKKVVAKDTLDKKKKLVALDKLLKGAESTKGLISIHKLKVKGKDKVYFEIPTSVFGKQMLFATKIAESSDPTIAYSGQMQTMRYLTIEREDDNIFFNNAYHVNVLGGDTILDIAKSFEKNNVPTHFEIFPVKGKSERDSSYVIDVTKFLMSTKDGFGLPKRRPFSGKANVKGAFQAEMSGVKEIQSFNENINVKCKLCFKGPKMPVTIVANRSFVLLPEEPMQRRMADKRLNYFKTGKSIYDETQYGSEKISFIHRWNINPKKEDIERYKAGELVEPEKPIIWYIDDATPEKWVKYIKLGIEDWQTAFEKIGFKNAIIAKNFPENDPDFNPDNISYNCFRYITMPIPNAMGPSWVDPRSGEIINATVYFAHDVFRLAKNWRFVQTAAVDPEARKKEMSVESMGEMIRNIAAHEIGHTLGLMHNFRASYAFPVDSLRSASFTQKYGNTASIMDYTRYNYVAQPGDKGVRLTPPEIGIYDDFSIKLGYTPIFDAPEEEVSKTINKWILDKMENQAYIFGPQFMGPMGMGTPPDPASQPSDLGNDHIKASKYGIKNLKYIMDHLLEWTAEEGQDFKYTGAMYKGVRRQFYTYLMHVVPYIGGVHNYDVVAGDGQKSFVPLSKKKQKEALKFLFDQVKDLPNWLNNDELEVMMFPGDPAEKWFQEYVLSKTMARGTLERLYFANRSNKNGYQIEEYLNDIYKHVWEPTQRGKRLNDTDRRLQYLYVYQILDQSGLKAKKSPAKKKKALTDFDFEGDMDVCHDEMNETAFAAKYDDGFSKIETRTVMFSQVKRLKYMLESAIKVTIDRKTKQHYEYLYDALEEIVE